jgi:hypothetical protein
LPKKPDWQTRRLDKFAESVVADAASDARKLFDALQIEGFKGEKPVQLFAPRLEHGRAFLDPLKEQNFYKTCSAIDHSFRVSVYSHWREWLVALGGTRLPAKGSDHLGFTIIIADLRSTVSMLST